MADTGPAPLIEALERIIASEEELESLDAPLLLGERAADDSGTRHPLEGVARELDVEDLLER
jgi:hypothetical protein